MLSNLFKEGSIGTMTILNRVVLPAMNTRFPTEEGYVTDQAVAYYRERAAGGTGLLIFESTYPCHPHPYRHRLTDDSYVDGLGEVVDAVHDAGSRIAIQMNVHRGPADHLRPLAPSSTTDNSGNDVPAIDRETIADLVDSYADGSERAVRAGFDGIEIHAASGYLLHQFLSPRTNGRTDRYGGSLKGRTRLAVELLDAVHSAVGASFPVWFRIPGDEFLEGGIDREEAMAIGRVLDETGADALHVTAGHHQNDKIVPSGYADHGVYTPLATAIRSSVDVPVITVGRINNPVLADEILAAGDADFTAMGRAHLADPHIVRKARAGEFDRIRRCVGGLEGCWDRLNGAPVTCTVNPTVGNEGNSTAPAEQAREVVVVGGGPGGLEAARVAAERGHNVTVYERQSQVGGQLLEARHAPGKSDYDALLNFFRAELEAYDVQVKCSRDIEPDELRSMDIDAIIVATGSEPEIPPIQGLSDAVSKNSVAVPEDVLGNDPFPFETAVVLGGDQVGCDVGIYLAQQGIEVTVVATDDLLSDRITETPKPGMRQRVMRRIDAIDNIKALEHASIVEIGEESVHVRTSIEDDRWIRYEKLVLAWDRVPNRTLLADDVDCQVEVVGDAESIGDLYTAIHDGARTGRLL